MSSTLPQADAMAGSGLDLARAFYRRHGVPLLARHAQLAGRVAAGLAGDGSDCLGFDDLHSRDHDWGPGFCLWLMADDFRDFGPALQRDYDALPQEFQGHRRQGGDWGSNRVGVFEIGAFYRGFIGRTQVPASLGEWLRIPEKNLAAATSGRVFEDPLGAFSGIRQGLLDFYPDDVRLAKMAARCMTAGQAGQYNLPRSVLRGDAFAAQYCEVKFCADILSLIHLLNRRYTPYFKWAQRSAQALPLLGAMVAYAITRLTLSRDADEKAALVDGICEAVAGTLRADGLSDAPGHQLLDHGPRIQAGIADPALRAMDVWAAP
jgi:hypothetical protein